MKTILILALATSSAFAGSSPSKMIETSPAKPSSDWWYTIAPYGWVTATEGDMGVAGRVAPVNITMKDTLEDLEMAFMLAAEVGYDRWAFGFDGVYGAFSDDAALPLDAAPYTNATMDFDQFFARVHAGYQIIKNDKATLTAFVGARYSYLSAEIDFTGAAPTISVDGSKSWIDPVIGMHGVWNLNDHWFLHGGGDIGGFGVSSDIIWQVNAAIGYRLTDSASVLIGYRGLGVDYTDGGFVVDTVAHGPVIGCTFQF